MHQNHWWGASNAPPTYQWGLLLNRGCKDVSPKLILDEIWLGHCLNSRWPYISYDAVICVICKASRINVVQQNIAWRWTSLTRWTSANMWMMLLGEKTLHHRSLDGLDNTGNGTKRTARHRTKIAHRQPTTGPHRYQILSSDRRSFNGPVRYARSTPCWPGILKADYLNRSISYHTQQLTSTNGKYTRTRVVVFTIDIASE